jgi:hypothetical protein
VCKWPEAITLAAEKPPICSGVKTFTPQVQIVPSFRFSTVPARNDGSDLRRKDFCITALRTVWWNAEGSPLKFVLTIVSLG